MGKYEALWAYVSRRNESSLQLSFDEIGMIAGVPIDHSFLKYKKELLQFGWQVEKISMKQQTVVFARIEGGDSNA